MPYSQIIILIIAFISIAGAPIGESPKFPLEIFLLFWSIKTIIWIFLILIIIYLGKIRDNLNTTLELLQWLTPLPLIIDLYFLDMRTHLEPRLIPFFITTLTNFFYLILYFFYVFIYWSFTWWTNRTRSLIKEISSRFTAILPAIIPFLIISLGEDILRFLPKSISKLFFENLYAQVFIYALFMILMIIFAPLMIKKIWRCESFPQGIFKTFIIFTAKELNLKFRDILLWKTPWGGSCTAGVMGFVPNFRYLLLTPCIVENLTLDELKAVLYHEFTHIKKMHIWWQMILIFSFALMVSILSEPVFYFIISNNLGFSLYTKLIDTPQHLVAIITVLPVILFAFLYLRLFMGYFIRNFEREADLGALEYQGHPYHMANALNKVAYLSGVSPYAPNWHHYSIAERVDFLKSAYENPQLVHNFKKTINTNRYLFILLTIAISATSLILPVDKWKEKTQQNIVNYVYDQIYKYEKNPEALMLLGQYFYEKKMYEHSFNVLTKAIKIAPNDPEILNMLAWLLLTSEDEKYIDVKWALELAQKAASLKDHAHILDTLAEAYYANGHYDKAVYYGEIALKKATENREHYIKQLNKFKEALNKSNAIKKNPPKKDINQLIVINQYLL